MSAGVWRQGFISAAECLNTDLKAVKKCFVYSPSFWYSSIIAADNRRRADSFRLSSNLWRGASTWVVGYWIQLWDSLIENTSKDKWYSVCSSLYPFCKLQGMRGQYSYLKKMGANYESSQELQETLHLGMRRLFFLAFHARLAFFLKLHIGNQKILHLEETDCCFDFGWYSIFHKLIVSELERNEVME